MGWLLIGVVLYVVGMFCYSYWLYKKSYVYFRPLTYRKDANSEEIDIHKKYHEFKVNEVLTFPRVFFGSLVFLTLRFPLLFIIAVSLIFQLRKAVNSSKSPETDIETRKQVKHIVSYWSGLLFKLFGISVHPTQLNYEAVYKKYLGDDYNIDINDDKYSLIISNHIGFFEVLYYMLKYTPGFIAKMEIRDYYFVGAVAIGLNCLFVNRESPEARKQIFMQLEKRQKAYYNKEIHTPLLLFPEGTTSAGRNILKFKKGAFVAGLPIKPVIMRTDRNANFSLACGSSHIVLNFFRAMTHWHHDLYFTELPVIRPTEYMYEKYKEFGKEKWEVFMEVVKRMYCEIGGFGPSEKGLEDSMKYIRSMRKGVYEEEEGKKEK